VNPWIAKAVIVAASLALIAIRAPYGHRSRSVKVARSFKSMREVVVLTLAWLGFFVPLIWVGSPLFAFAEYPLRITPLVLGVACYAAGLWLFHRSHADLGRFWSITLEVREGHRLITQGVYRRTRHPMYAAVFLYSIGQALALPNWFAGPSYLVVFGLLFAVRVGAEERMMIETFGDEYVAYRARTKRLFPGVW
jgi:protein-S-isoprenylcysteine O-methyltransferase Ste14